MGGGKNSYKSFKQAGWLKRQKLGVRKTREILRAQGKICLRCLSRPVRAIGGKRCDACHEERVAANKTKEAMKLTFEVLLDDPDAGYIVRAGNWVHTLMYAADGRVALCEWEWEPISSLEMPKPRTCLKHPRTVNFDGPVCPACQAEKEFLALTDGKEVL